MALVEPEAFGDEACARIYIAGRLREARRVEAALTAAGIDYFVEIEKFRKPLLGVIPREYDGAAFYVLLSRADTSRQILLRAGLRSGLVADDEEDDTPRT